MFWFISLENDAKQYLFSISSYESVTEFYNLENLEENDYLIMTTEKYLGHLIFSYAFSLFKLPVESVNRYLLLITFTEEDSNNKGNLIEALIFNFPEKSLNNINIYKKIQFNNYKVSTEHEVEFYKNEKIRLQNQIEMTISDYARVYNIDYSLSLGQFPKLCLREKRKR